MWTSLIQAQGEKLWGKNADLNHVPAGVSFDIMGKLTAFIPSISKGRSKKGSYNIEKYKDFQCWRDLFSLYTEKTVCFKYQHLEVLRHISVVT